VLHSNVQHRVSFLCAYIHDTSINEEIQTSINTSSHYLGLCINVCVGTDESLGNGVTAARHRRMQGSPALLCDVMKSETSAKTNSCMINLVGDEHSVAVGILQKSLKHGHKVVRSSVVEGGVAVLHRSK
jgi:hypothetical protein